MFLAYPQISNVAILIFFTAALACITDHECPSSDTPCIEYYCRPQALATLRCGEDYCIRDNEVCLTRLVGDAECGRDDDCGSGKVCEKCRCRSSINTRL